MSPILFIEDTVIRNFESNLFHVFSKEFNENIQIVSSFSYLSPNIFPIFTAINPYVKKKIVEANIEDYGIILDVNKIDIENLDFPILLKASFIYIIGEDKNNEINDIFSSMSHCKIYSNIVSNLEKGDKSLDLCDFSSLANVFNKVEAGSIDLDKIYVLKNYFQDEHIWAAMFKEYNVTLEFFTPNHFEYKLILSNVSKYLGMSRQIFADLSLIEVENSISVSNFSEEVLTSVISIVDKNNENISTDLSKGKIVNIVCFNPTYLFKDLVGRFEKIGCVHSDFPIPNADSYIWMRPQEIWHLEYLLDGNNNNEIGVAYRKAFQGYQLNKSEFKKIKQVSVAIHHGTCFEPLYQFNYEKLAYSLRDVKKVVGVCEIEECYGPSYNIANKHNFLFVPIGYDHNLFTKDFIKKEKRKPRKKLKIGFVGRAYGTKNKEQLKVSRLAEPKGYRKGGDILLEICLKLKALRLDFEVQILGQNWDELVESFDNYQIDNHYYARDKDLTYTDYPSVYGDFDILLISARCEGGPVSAIEAMSLGIDIVSTDVGVVKFLEKHTNIGCYTFDYDKKWHIADSESAVKKIQELYRASKTYEDRLKIRQSVVDFTTDHWVNEIFNTANEFI